MKSWAKTLGMVCIGVTVLSYVARAQLGNISSGPSPGQSATPDSIVQITAEAQGLPQVDPSALPPFGTFWWAMPGGGGAAPAGKRAAGRVRALGRCVQALVFFSFLAFLMGGPGRRVPTLAMPNQPRQQVRGSTQHTLGVCAWHLPSTHPRPPSRTGVGQEKIERECF